MTPRVPQVQEQFGMSSQRSAHSSFAPQLSACGIYPELKRQSKSRIYTTVLNE